jgi:hypothetical protein
VWVRKSCLRSRQHYGYTEKSIASLLHVVSSCGRGPRGNQENGDSWSQTGPVTDPKTPRAILAYRSLISVHARLPYVKTCTMPVQAAPLELVVERDNLAVAYGAYRFPVHDSCG